jgi:predicted transcriptional regulator
MSMALVTLLSTRPAVPPLTLARYQRDPRQAVGEHEIVCLVCGQPYRQLTNTHIQSHGMTSGEYKRAYGYNLRRPLMCHALRRLYSHRAVSMRLAARIRRRPLAVEPALRRRGGERVITPEETLTRQELQRRLATRRTHRDGLGRFVTRRALSP